jgi:hypothetical protein
MSHAGNLGKLILGKSKNKGSKLGLCQITWMKITRTVQLV